MSTNFSSLLNFFRWFSALLVILSHTRHLIFVDYQNIIDKNIFIKAFYFITGFGHEAVIIFFIISGFLVGGLTLEKWLTKIQYKIYLVDRFSRIYIVLIPAIFIGGGLDWLGSNYVNGSEIYTNSARYQTSSLGSVISTNLNFETLFGNALNLQNIFFPIFGSNGPLWSLANEWWYYIIFATLLDKKPLNKLFSASIAVTIILCLPFKITYMMLIWLLGVLILQFNKFKLPTLPTFISLIIFIIVLVISRLSHNPDNLTSPESDLIAFTRDMGFGFAFSLLLISCNSRGFYFPFSYIHKLLADFSYSIYLFHFPIFIFLMALSHDFLAINFMQQPNSNCALLFLGIILVIYILSYLISLITERHTKKLRNFILTKILH